MSYVIFDTPTQLDLKAITTFGLNAKPNSKSPIGYFGTGLKMAIAVLVRHNIPVQLFIGHTKYVFYTKAEDFRGKEFAFVRMKKETTLGWGYTKLPFTTNLAKNWELWMAFRELESNTRDEGGFTWWGGDNPTIKSDPDHTKFVVGPSEAFRAEWAKKDETFLKDGLREPTIDLPDFQVFRNSSKYVYYRGMRVLTLDKPSLFTYNVLSQSQLTEDRTLKDQFWLPYRIVNYLFQSEDRALLNHYLNCTPDYWEYGLPVDDSLGYVPGPTFLDVVRTRRKAPKSTFGSSYASSSAPLYWSPRFGTLVDRHTAKSEPLRQRFREWWEEFSLKVTSCQGDLIQDTDEAMINEVAQTLAEHE
jgi:hypothetical protein